MRRCGLLLLAFLIVFPALAQAQMPVRIRGAIEVVDGDDLFVRSREGATLKVGLAGELLIHAVIPAAPGAINPGKLVGIAGTSRPDGRVQAIEVLAFPDEMRAAAPGLPWDLPPGGTMTLGTVMSLLEQPAHRELTLSVGGAPRQILVSSGVPVLTIAPGDRALLAPGAYIVMAAQRAPDGSLSTSHVIVGTEGYVPPM